MRTRSAAKIKKTLIQQPCVMCECDRGRDMAACSLLRSKHGAGCKHLHHEISHCEQSMKGKTAAQIRAGHTQRRLAVGGHSQIPTNVAREVKPHASSIVRGGRLFKNPLSQPVGRP